MKPKVVIGWGDNGNTRGEFTKSMLDLQLFELKSPAETYELLPALRTSGLYVTENRNQIVRQAMNAGADWLLQLDADESFPPELLRTIMRTADAENRPIVTGIYANIGKMEGDGSFNILNCIYAELPDGQYRALVPPENMQPFQIDAAGTGVLLTHLSVFSRIPAPWFWLYQIEINGHAQFMNEDIGFFRLARDHGFQIWCDPLADVTHWKTIPLLPSTFGSFLRKAEEKKNQLERGTNYTLSADSGSISDTGTKLA